MLFAAFPANAATTLLPPGMQCFTDATGAVISGSVNMFYPNTTTAKPTWQDSLQAALNSQPIQLDGNGCATIYGIGSYRQQLYDGPVVGGNTSGSLLFDKITTDTSAYNSTFWAGLSGGTANVITLVDPGFNATDGTVINFTALATNTGSTTINPSGFGAISVVKSTTAGPVSLVGGEIIQSNQISVVYSASANTFTILNPPIQSASGNTAPLCGASGLKIVNGGSPNSIISVTANSAVMVSSAGIVQSRNNISLTNINITTGTVTSTVNGMDGEAPGVSDWLYVWLVDNGSATGAIVSLSTGNGLAPSLPSGYTFKCRAGSVRVDGSGNLLRTLQYGINAQYTIVTATNTPIAPNIANGVAGTFSATSPVLASVSVATFVPPTAVAIKLSASAGWKGGAFSDVLVAPNTDWGGVQNGPAGSLGQSWPIYLASAGASGRVETYNMLLESTNIAWTTNGAGGAISALGWTEGGVNAN